MNIPIISDIQTQLEPISKFFYIITNPRIIFDWIVGISYWLAVIISISSLIFYVGTKSTKSKQLLNGTIIAYILLQAFASAI